MKIAVLSDIHGNWPALKAIFDSIPSFDLLIVLGDTIGYYPQFEKCIIALQKYRAKFLLGNHEAYIRGDIPQPSHSIFSWYHNFFYSYGSQLCKDWIFSLPSHLTMTIDSRLFYFCHGSPFNLTEYIYPDFDQWSLYNDFNADILISGHTHVPMIIKSPFRDLLIVNSGSVGLGRRGFPSGSYAIIDTYTLEIRHHHVKFDQQLLIASIHQHVDDPTVRNFLLRSLNPIK